MNKLKKNSLAISSILDVLFLTLTIICFYLSGVFDNSSLIIPGIICFILALFLFIGIVKILCKFALKYLNQN